LLSGGFVLLAVLAERFFGFQLGRRQWVRIVLVAVSLALLGLTGTSSGGDHSDYSAPAMIIFEGVAIALGMLLIFSGRLERVRAQYGVLLGAAAGLGFGISVVAIKALSGDLESGIGALVSPWTALVVTAAVASFFASARSLQIGDGVAVIAVTLPLGQLDGTIVRLLSACLSARRAAAISSCSSRSSSRSVRAATSMASRLLSEAVMGPHARRRRRRRKMRRAMVDRGHTRPADPDRGRSATGSVENAALLGRLFTACEVAVGARPRRGGGAHRGHGVKPRDSRRARRAGR
jgi:hypothetical protein